MERPAVAIDDAAATEASQGSTFNGSFADGADARLSQVIEAAAEAFVREGEDDLAGTGLETEVIGLSETELKEIRTFAEVDKKGASTRLSLNDASKADVRDDFSEFASNDDFVDVPVTSPNDSSDGAEQEFTAASDDAVEPASEEEERDPADDFFPDELEEADFFIRQGLLDEARDILLSILEDVPESWRAQGMLATIDKAESEDDDDDAAGSPAEFSGEGDNAFDLATELLDDLEDLDLPEPEADADVQYSVDEVFSQFKRGVEASVSADDAGTHYDLGIAYREMGLLEDAINEFEIAANSSEKKADSLYMVGICHVDLGRPEKAVESFREALKLENASPVQKLAILFELGAGYQQLGDDAKAHRYLEKVYKKNPKFKDVAQRIETLGGAGGKTPGSSAKKGKNISYL